MRIRCLDARPVLNRWLREEDGVAATEYAILLALLVIGSMGIIGSIGSKFAVLYETMAGAMPEGM